jgi:protein PsiE
VILLKEGQLSAKGDTMTSQNSNKDINTDLLHIAEKWTDSAGNLLVSLFHRITLFGIGAATVWSSATTFHHIIEKGSSSIQDLLLLFIYLEIGAMVGIYFKTNHMPVRFLIYVAITAVTRLIIDLVNKHEANMEIFLLGATIFILALANALVRYASYKFPSNSSEIS